MPPKKAVPKPLVGKSPVSVEIAVENIKIIKVIIIFIIKISYNFQNIFLTIITNYGNLSKSDFYILHLIS